MARGHNPSDRRTTREADSDAESAVGGTEDEAEAVDEEMEAQVTDEDGHPRPELRWVQIRRPRGAVEIGRNGRILDSHYHSGYDAWEVLLETYEGELSE